MSIWTWIALTITIVLTGFGVYVVGWRFIGWIFGLVMSVVLFLPTLLTVQVLGFKIDSDLGLLSTIAWAIVLYVLIPTSFVALRRWRMRKSAQKSTGPGDVA
ncbi:MAG: hypothetical protein F4Z14_07635 [Gammaproteobacteria bacterium]|nr:hypothetical protein [Gammaproteobacteria bacterium]